MIREKLLEFLKCPLCLAPLAANEDKSLLCLNGDCRARYEVIDGKIPNLLPDEAEGLGEDEWRALIEQLGAKPADPGAEPKRRRGKPRPKKSAS